MLRLRYLLIIVITLLVVGCQPPQAPATATPAPTAQPTTPAPTRLPATPNSEPAPTPGNEGALPEPLPGPEESGGLGTDGMPWWNDRIFYEIFVRSFQDSDGDGIGDLQGLISRLDYLNDGDPATDDDLGVTGIWLMPVMESPSYHGYDVVDYYTIEQDYGDMEDFKALLEEAHKRGIVVIVDLVMNHTSVQHPWFQESRIPGSEKEDWYIWEDQPSFSSGPWGQTVWHEDNGRYYYGIFWEGMPDLNLTNPEVTEQLYDINRYWLEDVGVDGFRLDAVKHLIEEGRKQGNTNATHAWLEDYHDYYKSISPYALTVGEAWTQTDEAVEYIPDEVDIVFEFDLARGMLDSANSGVRGPVAIAQGTVDRFYPPGQYAAILSNHDQDRVMTQLGGDVAAAKLAATMLLTNEGVPFIYYGEEIGMQGQKPDERIRTPMQWDDSVTAGFTDGRPWQTLAPGHEDANVAGEDEDPDSLLNHYRTLTHLRNAHPALRVGDLIRLKSSDQAVYAYLRQSDDELILVLLNLGDAAVEDYRLSLKAGDLSGDFTPTMLFGEGEPTAPALNASGGFDAYTPLPQLAPQSSYIIRLQ